jgi:plasmid stabilization system protein ParE
MEVDFLLAAEVDLLEAYERHGEGLHTKLSAAIELIKGHPEIGPTISRKIRRKLVRRSPYAIYYVLETSRIVIHAIVDQREDPTKVADRLRRI